VYKPNEFAKKLNISVKTLPRWDSDGKLPAKRTLSGHRYYTEEDLLIAKGLKPPFFLIKVVVYCRVSSNAQKPELKNQVIARESFCLGAVSGLLVGVPKL
jgi:predicted site-specific integrase-resolvase